ncbi:MAG: hypothetical protein Q8873_02685, partial [Bacillota bacterium]|nr:hypothetical protein [Bacillota bacterium]
IPDMKIVRFFPYKVNPSYGSYDDLEEEVSDLMASQIKLLNAKTKIAMSLTAGMDSRLSLAASKDICADIDYFTFLTKNASHIEDAKIAQQICTENDLKHNLYQWDNNKNSEGLKEFEYIWERNLGIRRGILWLNKLYIDSFPKDRIHLRSNIAEVVKCDSYDSEKCEPLSAQQLANLYTHTLMKNDDKVLRKFSEFINITDFTQNNMYNYDYRDLFEWEYKMCLWHSWLLLESDVSHDTFLLYNNREILSKMLSLPYQDRADKKIFIGMIKRLWPDLLKYPINKKIYI